MWMKEGRDPEEQKRFERDTRRMQGQQGTLSPRRKWRKQAKWMAVSRFAIQVSV